MRSASMAAAVGLALGAAVLPATAATADGLPQPEVKFVGANVVAHGDEAYIQAKFRCWGGEEGTHLWASIKQGGPDPTAEGSGMTSTAWYDTNYQYANDPAGQTIECDGKWHSTKFTVKLVDHPFGTDYVSQQLSKGEAWVQFCVFDSTATEDGSQGFASVSQWGKVVGQQ